MLKSRRDSERLKKSNLSTKQEKKNRHSGTIIKVEATNLSLRCSFYGTQLCAIICNYHLIQWARSPRKQRADRGRRLQWEHVCPGHSVLMMLFKCCASGSDSCRYQGWWKGIQKFQVFGRISCWKMSLPVFRTCLSCQTTKAAAHWS